MKVERWLIINKPRNRYDSRVKIELKNKKPTPVTNKLFVKFNVEFPDNIFENRFEIDLKIDETDTKKVKVKANVTDKIVNL